MGILREPKVWREERALATTRRSSDLTPEEKANVRKALRFLSKRFGSWPALAKAMSANEHTVWTSAHKGAVTAGIALRAARVAGVPLEEMLSGAWPPASACPHCGRCG